MATATLNRAPTKHATSSNNIDADAPHSKAVMRQTQALMGVILLGGVAAAAFINMAWAAVPAFIGIGMLFAGLSGTCAMASLVALMPWNKAAESAYKASKGDSCCGRCG
jgi:hypothetical protein